MSIDPFATTGFRDCEPEFLVSGQHTGWKRALGFSDVLFSTKYEFRAFEAVDDKDDTNNPTGTLTINGTYDADLEVWLFEHSDEITDVDAAEYTYDLIVTRTSDSKEKILSTGYMKFHSSTSDRRTHAEIMVSKIQSVLEGRADSDIDSYTIKGRSIDKMSPKDLTMWYDYYRNEVVRTGGSTVDGVGRSSPKNNTVRLRFV